VFKPEDVLEGTRSIRPYLPDLLGTEAEEVDRQLAELLEKANTEQKVDQQILEILKSRPKTRNWMAEFLSPKQQSKGWQQLPGSSGAVSARKYVCPQGDYVWYRRSAGILVPSCPTHGNLIPADEG
jgi:hypothetical protein